MSAKGCFVTLGVVGLVAVVGLNYVFKTGKSVVEDFAAGVGVSPSLVKETQNLNDKYEFREPEDKRLSEEQLKKFISIKRDFAEKFKEHRQELEALGDKANGESGFREARQAYKILGEIRKDFLKSLRRHEMSPREYGFLTAQVYSAYVSKAARKGYEQAASAMPEVKAGMEKQLQELRKQLDNPDLTDEARGALEQARASLKQAMTRAESSGEQLKEKVENLPEVNADLIEKHRSELEDLNTLGLEYWGLAVSGGN